MKAIFAYAILTLSFMLAPFSAQAEVSYTKKAVENWIVAETKSLVSTATVKRIVNAVFAQAQKHSIDPLLILSTIKQESRFRVQAKSSYGAKGLMQVVPRWHGDKIAGRNIYNIETNIEVGTQVLVDCLDKFNGAVSKALRCYSGDARKYEANLRANHKAIKQADVLFRFENELPMNVAHVRFDKPFLPAIKQDNLAEQKTLYALNP